MLRQIFTIPYAGLPYSRAEAKYIDFSTVELNATLSTSLPTMIYKTPNIPPLWSITDLGSCKWTRSPSSWSSSTLAPFTIPCSLGQMVRADLLPANTTFVPTYYGSYDPAVRWDLAP